MFSSFHLAKWSLHSFPVVVLLLSDKRKDVFQSNLSFLWIAAAVVSTCIVAYSIYLRVSSFSFGINARHSVFPVVNCCCDMVDRIMHFFGISLLLSYKRWNVGVFTVFMFFHWNLLLIDMKLSSSIDLKFPVFRRNWSTVHVFLVFWTL